MKRLSIIALALFALSAQTSTGWVTLFNGKDLNNFNQVGTAELEDRRRRRPGHHGSRASRLEGELHRFRDQG